MISQPVVPERGTSRPAAHQKQLECQSFQSASCSRSAAGRDVPRSVAMALATSFKFFIAISLLLLAPGVAHCRATERPNIILLLTDDMGYGDVACYGGKFAPTPNIDRLAREGIRFTQ